MKELQVSKTKMNKLLNSEIQKEIDSYKTVNRKVYPQAIVTNEGELVAANNFVILEETSLITISTDDYITINSEALCYLIQVLTPYEYVELSKILTKTKTAFNVVFNGQYPHTQSTLIDYLNCNSLTFRRFVNKLQSKGILYVLKGVNPKTRRVERTYLINPFISRKRKTFDKQLSYLFADVKMLIDMEM